jgi:putative ubiquitin-RnfH superfamily antitoxin RatB of RatAB toxin-antitoxin module
MVSPGRSTGKFRGIRRPRQCRKMASDRVCTLIRQGHGLRAIAAREGMPTLDTLTQWLVEDSDFRARYERACHAQREVFAGDVVTLADAIAESDLAGIKLRIDARKWRVGVLGKDVGNDAAAMVGVDNDVIERLQAAADRIARANAAAADAPSEASADDAEAGADFESRS